MPCYQENRKDSLGMWSYFIDSMKFINIIMVYMNWLSCDSFIIQSYLFHLNDLNIFLTCFVRLSTYFTDSEIKPQNAQNTLDISFAITLSAHCLYAYLMSFRTRYSGIIPFSHKNITKRSWILQYKDSWNILNNWISTTN